MILYCRTLAFCIIALCCQSIPALSGTENGETCIIRASGEDVSLSCRIRPGQVVNSMSIFYQNNTHKIVHCYNHTDTYKFTCRDPSMPSYRIVNGSDANQTSVMFPATSAHEGLYKCVILPAQGQEQHCNFTMRSNMATTVRTSQAGSPAPGTDFASWENATELSSMQDSSGFISTDTIVGVAIGVTALLVITAIGIFVIIYKRKANIYKERSQVVAEEDPSNITIESRCSLLQVDPCNASDRKDLLENTALQGLTPEEHSIALGRMRQYVSDMENLTKSIVTMSPPNSEIVREVKDDSGVVSDLCDAQKETQLGSTKEKRSLGSLEQPTMPSEWPPLDDLVKQKRWIKEILTPFVGCTQFPTEKEQGHRELQELREVQRKIQGHLKDLKERDLSYLKQDDLKLLVESKFKASIKLSTLRIGALETIFKEFREDEFHVAKQSKGNLSLV